MTQPHRITLTLPADQHIQLQAQAQRSGKTLNAVVNDTIRTGLAALHALATKPPGWPCVDMGAPKYDLTKALALADALDDARAIAAITPFNKGNT
jgi:hypothetical protein